MFLTVNPCLAKNPCLPAAQIGHNDALLNELSVTSFCACAGAAKVANATSEIAPSCIEFRTTCVLRNPPGPHAEEPRTTCVRGVSKHGRKLRVRRHPSRRAHPSGCALLRMRAE